MEVRTFPNSRRPGVGLPPKRESQRPLLPQHARHCPVLEAGSALGFMVYPPLNPNESFLVEFQGEGRYQFTYYLLSPAAHWEPIFAVALSLPVGSIGIIKEDVTFMISQPPITKENAKQLARSFYVPEDLGTPQGAVTLRGATNFRTPEGWDTVYTPIFNNIERPVAPMMVVRVETDWYAHESEFRYVLQPGEGISGQHHLPIGQVVFVPREEITFRECNERELEDIAAARSNFVREKAAHTVKTPYGLQYSPHYLKQSRARKP
jgi:hypothetical protein